MKLFLHNKRTAISKAHALKGVKINRLEHIHNEEWKLTVSEGKEHPQQKAARAR